MSFQSINPATNEVLSTWPPHNDSQIEQVLAGSSAAYQSWSRETFDVRADVLTRLAGALRGEADNLALLATREMGKPITQARAEVEKCAVLCEHYAEHGAKYLESETVDLSPGRGEVVYQPLGPVFSIAPWNFPYWQVLRFAVPTLALGNTVVLKHAPNVLGCSAALAALFESIDAPENVFQQVVAANEQAAAIIRDNRIVGVALTGSERAGAAVAQIAGGALKKCVLELGGSDPLIVLADADLEAAAAAAATSRFANAGQVCIAAKRILVASQIAGRFAEAFVEAAKALELGDPELETTFLGPMARADLRDELWDQVRSSVRQGAAPILEGGPLEGPGNYFAPSILFHVPEHAEVRRKETFGPAAALLAFDGDEDAIRVANESPYGLSASIWSLDEAHAKALAMRLETGNVFINAISSSDPRMPFGGIKRSGFGRELGRSGMLEFANAKSITIAAWG